MATQPEPYLDPEDYLAIEREATFKSEYFAGEIFAMSGASERHNMISANVLASLHGQFRGRSCRVYSSDMRVRVSPTGLYTYPDVVAVCEEAQFDDEHLDTLLNPTVLFEVLSPSTEGYDRGQKFEHYRKGSCPRCKPTSSSRRTGIMWSITRASRTTSGFWLRQKTSRIALCCHPSIVR